MTRTTKILNLAFVLTTILFVLDLLTGFDIKSQILKTSIYFSFLVGTPVILLWNFFFIKTKSLRLIGTLFPSVLLILILILNPISILFTTGAWSTQTILYQHGHFSFKTIEYQMQDIGARGYNDREVEVIYLTPLFMVTSESPTNLDKRVEWIKVDKNVNELGLKTP